MAKTIHEQLRDLHIERLQATKDKITEQLKSFSDLVMSDEVGFPSPAGQFISRLVSVAQQNLNEVTGLLNQLGVQDPAMIPSTTPILTR